MTHLGRPTPIGPLMREHVLIGMITRIVKEELEKQNRQRLGDTCFVLSLVDFFRTYADRCHHGKEENILFRDLAKKVLSEEHEKTMNELIQEHVYARQLVAKLQNEATRQAEKQSENTLGLKNVLKELVEFYPLHIEKEDKRFFYPILEYFTQGELDAMIQEFREFDRKMIHEKYEVFLKSLTLK